MDGNDCLHPTLRYLTDRLAALLSIVQLEEHGHAVEPDAFRLKNLSDWAFEDHATVFDSLGSPSGRCNLHCKFCYEDGNPLRFGDDILSVEEAATRIRHFRPDAHKGLPAFHTRLYKEPFTNRHLLQILGMVRQADPDVEIPLTTNGSLFTPQLLDELAELVPVNLCVSLNSSRPEGRRELTGDRNSAHSIRMIEALQARHLPFSGSIVAWPGMAEGELEETVRFLDAHQARMIRVSLPGFSRFFAPTPPFDTQTVWQEVLQTVLPLRADIATPLLVLPSLYHAPALVPEIAGVIRSSPAARAGLRHGDVITAIEGVPVHSRTAAKQRLAGLHQQETISLVVKRDNGSIPVLLMETGARDEAYPYRPLGYAASKSHPFGLVLTDDFDPAWIMDMLRRILAHQAKNVLIMTSAIMEPVVSLLLDSLPNLDAQLGDAQLSLWVPEHRYWGGNIMMGDLYTCSDYLHAVQDFMERQGTRPDLLILPGSFSPDGFTDLVGVPVSTISQRTGIPVERIDCAYITL